MPEQFINFFGVMDGILIVCLALIALGIMVLVVLKQRQEEKRVYGVTTLLDTLRSIALLDPDTIKNTCPRLISKTDFQQFFELTKNFETALPVELEQSVIKALPAEKIAQIQNTARHSWRKWRRIEALLLLGYINAPEATPILKEGITSRDEDIEYFSMLALAKIHTVESARLLLNFLTRRVFSGYKIVSLLESFPPSIVDEAAKFLDHYDPFVRFWVVKLLVKFKPVSLLEKIIIYSKDPSPDVRAASCECLGELALPQAKHALLECLEDEVWYVRMHAVRSLYKIEGTHCLAEVISLINDKAWLVKESVKEIMADDIEASLSHVVSCLREGDLSSQRVCVGALVDAGYIKTLLNNVLSQEASVREKAVQLLSLLVNSDIHFGLKKTLDTFSENDHKKILAVIYTINKDLAGHIDQH